MSLEIGSLLRDRYRIIERLAQSSMGTVYKAHDEVLNVDVALKEGQYTTEGHSRQFRQEATILAKLRHPNLPRVIDHFVIEDQGEYLVMDFVTGQDLDQRLADLDGPLPEAEAAQIGAVVCDGRKAGAGLDIHLMMRTGARLTALTTDPADDYQPAWRP